jgi:uncharacterized protein (DUF362 family)
MGNLFSVNGRALVSKVVFSGELGRDIERAVTAIGGFGRLVKPGDTIMVKPNFNTADPPPGSSDPEFVGAVVKLLYAQGAERVILGESSTLGLSARKTLEQAGMLSIARDAGIEVELFDEGEWVTVETGGSYLKKVGLAKAAIEAEKIVYVGCLKTHFLADFTMSLKLAMGFVRHRDRLGMHARNLREKLADLNLAIGPDLIILDGRRAFISGGPSKGELREPGLVLASGDRIALDVEALKIIQGYKDHNLKAGPWDLPLIKRAVELGLGARSEEEYEVV